MARSLVGSSASGPYARKLRLLEAQRAHLRAAVEIRQTLPALERERGERPPPPYVAGGSLRSRGSPVAWVTGATDETPSILNSLCHTMPK